MLNHSRLDNAFRALADPTRRRIVERLSRGPASVSELAQPFAMTVPAIVHHLRLLEQSGLVRSTKQGRVRTCRIEPAAMRDIEQWVALRRRHWEERLDRLERVLSAPAKPSQRRKEAE